MTNKDSSHVDDDDDDLSLRIRREALLTLEEEPALSPLLKHTILAPGVESFEDAVAVSISYRLLDSKHAGNQSSSSIDPEVLRQIFWQAMHSSEWLEGGHTMSEAVRSDVRAVMDRDPACQTVLEVVLFFKGFAALVGHRVARQQWFQSLRKHSLTALFLQSQCSAVFGVDIHPAATIGAGVLLDHGTGIVIGETAVIGDGCTLLHGVTLGGTGKASGDRHPKVGKHVLIGAGASILGNIQLGDACKIGAGSIVLRAIPAGATAVGAPAKIIGRALETDPASGMDKTLRDVALLRDTSSSTSTSTTEEEPVSSDDDADDDDGSLLRGTKTNKHCNPTKNNKNWCPFRAYTRMSKRAPPCTITICTLRKMLVPEGCSQDEIGSLFFSLDKKNVGYIHRDVFEKVAGDAIAKHTSLPKERIQDLVPQFLAHHPMTLQDHGREKGSLKISKADIDAAS